MADSTASWLQTLVLALIQGLSEFLPISSSAHLVLPSQLLGWPDQGLLFDVAVHVGTLMAVMVYFRRDLLVLLGDIYPPLAGNQASTGELWRLGVATLPAVLAGVLLSDTIEQHFRGLEVIATTTIVFGLLLGWSSRRAQQVPADVLQTVTWSGALVIGFAQMLALIPGVSRSGVTITAGLFLGYSSATAARFSFLMSMPIIAGAMLFLGLDAFAEGFTKVPLAQILAAVVVSAISAYATIALFIGLLARIGMMPFVWYRLVLGLLLVLVIMFGS